jgi:hypothetical protein
MITFKITLRPAEIMPLANIINHLMKITEHSVTAIDYIDFYNIQHFVKMLFDKKYKLQTITSKKKVTMQVNGNVFHSLLHLFNLNGMQLNQPENIYSKVIYQDILFQMDKQACNIVNEYKILNY